MTTFSNKKITEIKTENSLFRRSKYDFDHIRINGLWSSNQMLRYNLNHSLNSRGCFFLDCWHRTKGNCHSIP